MLDIFFLTICKIKMCIGVRIARDSVLRVPTTRGKDDEELETEAGAEYREVVASVVHFFRNLVNVLPSVSVTVRLVEVRRATRD